MNRFSNADTKDGFSLKLWRGERMCLIGMDVEDPEADFVGFSIEVQSPGKSQFEPLRNRIAFNYDRAVDQAVDGFRNFSSLDAPFQKFRWVHFPYVPTDGNYIYRVTKQHMPRDGVLKAGTSITLNIPLDVVVYDDYLDVGFARNFASSQAYVDKFANNPNVIPAKADDGLKFHKADREVYEWLGFEAYQMIMDFLKEVANDESLSLDFFAYDLNEPDIVGWLEKMGGRLRAIIDNSKDHAPPSSAESQAAKRLRASSGAQSVKRMHFNNLQHNKVLIAKKNGKPLKVLFGSTNFSFRGIYIQANNALIFHSPAAAELFESVFELAFQQSSTYLNDNIFKKWHLVQESGKPDAHFYFSPHSQPDLALSPVGAAIDQATSSVFFSIAFLYQTKTGPVREAIDRLMKKPVFSYGISDRAGGLTVRKPDGSFGIVDFSYLAGITPMPFKAEWSGGSGIHEHHKFVVTDFSLPTAKVFTGSSNLSRSGEHNNGDNLVVIEDQRIATSYAIEALRVFDHLQFRTVMDAAFGKGGKKGAKKKAKRRIKGKRAKDEAPSPESAPPPSRTAAVQAITLKRPTAISGKPAWFVDFYKEDTQKERDRKLFGH